MITGSGRLPAMPAMRLDDESMQNARSGFLKAPAPTLAGKRETFGLIGLLVVYISLVLTLGTVRQYLGYGTETDYVSGFVPEAQRVLAGEPLQSTFHPPFYSIVVAVVYSIVNDLLIAGLLISCASGAVTIITSYLFFYDLCSRQAAWASVLTLLGSGVFIRYSAAATSDVFFLALFMTCCLLALKALRSGSLLLWGACGTAVGLSLMTRTNALTLAILVLMPFLHRASLGSKVKAGLALLFGIATPLLALVLFAAATGSNLLPSQNHLNIAMTYFATDTDRMSGDARLQVAERFDNTREVLLHAPLTIVRTYLSDLYSLTAVGLTEVVEMPLYYLFAPGLLLLFVRHGTRMLAVLGAVVFAQVLLVNLKFFEPRLHLFLVPWLGAAVGETCWWLLRLPLGPRVRLVFSTLVAVMFLTAAALATTKAYLATRADTRELTEVVPVARQLIGEDAVIFARKPHLAFYVGASIAWLPHLNDLDELRNHLQAHPGAGPFYIFYGENEQARRPQYAALGGSAPPEWVDVVARSPQPDGWVLLRAK